MSSGFFKLYRKFFTHPLWTEKRPLSRAEAFLDLLQLAAFKPTVKLSQGNMVSLNVGQLIGSERYLAGRWDWSTKKVRSFLVMLEDEQMAVIEKKREGSILTLSNYSRYAFENLEEEAPKKRQRSAEEAPRKRIEEGEEGEELKNLEIIDFWNSFPTLPNVRSVSLSRKRMITTRMKDSFFSNNWKSAIEMIPSSKFLTGTNDRGWTANIDWFLRPDTAAKIIEGKYSDSPKAHSNNFTAQLPTDAPDIP